ncbi:type II secretion system F family protein [Paenibacillus alginolyticus]|uniref:type II secretion system F family protein n=1 Tax=Paenibacillus alginolyticus TaxID=59839 RepID=UPI00041B59B3|nr:type II secretion system F family protein [Paenibacillus alginolyticus]MCY9668731.1 type II secretion system F family protein [Paenibacillus alginolyticus]
MIGLGISIVGLLILAGVWQQKRERWIAFRRFMLGSSAHPHDSIVLQWLERRFPFAPARSLPLIISLFILPVLLGIVMALSQQSWVPVLLGVAASLFGPWGTYSLKSYIWKRRCRNQMKDALRLASTALRAGTTFAEALARAALELPEPMSGLLLQANREIRLGKPEGEAFHKLAEQTGVSDFSSIAGLIELTIVKGGKLPYILDDVVNYMEEDEELLADLRGETSSYRMSAYLLPLLLLGLLLWFWPAISPMLNQTWFFVLFVAALSFMSVGLFLTYRLVRKLDV